MEESTDMEVVGLQSKEDIYNANLPYFESIPSESEAMLQEICFHLCRAVHCEEEFPSVSYWARRLNHYIDLYRMKIPQEKCVLLVKSLYSIVVLPSLDQVCREDVAKVLARMLKKKRIFRSQSFELAWRPLYSVMKQLFGGKTRYNWFYRRTGSSAVFFRLFDECRRFFPAASTREILEEFEPYLCFHDVCLFEAQGYLVALLPTNREIPPQQGYKLWFAKFLQIWDWIEHTEDWNRMWITLYARLACDNIGLIDWEPVLPYFFNKFQVALELPVGGVKVPKPYSHRYPNEAVCFVRDRDDVFSFWREAGWFISSIIVPEGGAQTHLEELFQALQSFLHPSNSGNWSVKIGSLMSCLTFSFGSRLQEESEPDCYIPPSHRIGPTERQRFVASMEPLALTALFSKSSVITYGASYALKNLAYFEPTLILNNVLEQVYPALETLTHTHRTSAAIRCLAEIVRPLLWYSHFPEGLGHLCSLLRLTLPGIDVNDSNKTCATFKFYFNLLNCLCLENFVPSMDLYADVTEAEREMMSLTVYFEDWVVELIRKIFDILEVCPAPLKGDKASSNLLTSVIIMFAPTLFSSLSFSLYQVAVHYLLSLVRSNKIYDSVKAVAKLCGAAVQVNPKVGLALFVPYIYGELMEAASREKETGVDKKDPHLLWFLHMLVQVVKDSGAAILEYRRELVCLLRETLYLPSRHAVKLSAKVLRNLLKSLTTIYPVESAFLARSDARCGRVPSFKLWGSAGDLLNLGVDWHCPSVAELDFADELVELFLMEEMKILREFYRGYRSSRTISTDPATHHKEEEEEETCAGLGAAAAPFLSRDLVWCKLTIVRNVLTGVAVLYPESVAADAEQKYCGDPQRAFVPLCPRLSSLVVTEVASLRDRKASCGAYQEKRLDFGLFLHETCEFLLGAMEDDTRLCKLLIKMMCVFVCNTGVRSAKIAKRKRTLEVTKKMMRDLVRPQKSLVRFMLIARVYLQHCIRLSKNSTSRPYTVVYERLLHDLLALSSSRYSVVRSKAQGVLGLACRCFGGSKRDIFGLGLKQLEETGGAEFQYRVKGILYVFVQCPLLKYLSTEFRDLFRFLMALCECQKYEKSSIQKLVTKLHRGFSNSFYTPMVEYSRFPAEVKLLLARVSPQGGVPCAEFLGESLRRFEARNASRVEDYYLLCDGLVAKLGGGSLHWRYELILTEALFFLVRGTYLPRRSTVEWFLKGTVNENAHLRKLCYKGLGLVLSLSKKKIPKYSIFGPHASTSTSGSLSSSWENCSSVSGSSGLVVDGEEGPSVYGYRGANSFYCLEGLRERWFGGAEEYDACLFVDKNYIGWGKFPRQLVCYLGGESDGIKRESDGEGGGWSECDGLVLGYFRDCDFVRRLLLCMVNTKYEGDLADDITFMFKGVFRNFGLLFFEGAFLPILDSLLDATLEELNSHLVVAQVLGGILRASKAWDYCSLQDGERLLRPLIGKAFRLASNETLSVWSNFVRFSVYDRDVRRLSWFVSLVLDFPVDMEHTSSFEQAKNLLFAEIVMQEFSWRSSPLVGAYLGKLERYLDSPYKLVRDKIGRFLHVLFRNVCSPAGLRPEVPFEYLSSSLGVLVGSEVAVCEEGEGERGSELFGFCGRVLCLIRAQKEFDLNTSAESTSYRKVSKTVCQWITHSFVSGCSMVIMPFYMRFFGAILEMSESIDRELEEMSTGALMSMSLGRFTYVELYRLLRGVESIFGGDGGVVLKISWHGKIKILKFLQVLIFRNLFFQSHATVRLILCRIIMGFLCDLQLEVRECASETFSGLIRCNPEFLGQEFLGEFYRLAAIPLPVRPLTQPGVDVRVMANLSVEMKHKLGPRHAGVLGMSAVILAFPYSIPAFLPALIVVFGEHLHDPLPIRTTVRKTLSEFWRTHQDDWRNHCLAFSVDQLAVIQELLVSPSYYA